MKRDSKVVDLRPNIDSIKTELMKSLQERFQNEVLRPIIKFQHELILDIFKAYLKSKKIQFDLISIKNQALKITTIFQKDRALTMQMQSIIIAYFTTEEYEKYTLMKSAINKRIVQIIKERIINTLVK